MVLQQLATALKCGRSAKKAFTLVELLVVIGIIAVLIAILLPALVRARSMAQAIACRSNLRQLAIADSMYQNEWHGYFVPWAEAPWPYEGKHWVDFMMPMVRSGTIFNCPTANNLRPESMMKSNGAGVCNLAYNLNYGGYLSDGGNKYNKISLALAAVSTKSGIPKPRRDQLISFADGRWWISSNSTGTDSEDWNLPWRARFVHPNGTMNAAFMDTHIEALTLKKVYTDVPFTKWLIAAKPNR